MPRHEFCDDLFAATAVASCAYSSLMMEPTQAKGFERVAGAYDRAAKGRFSSRFCGFIRSWPCGLAMRAR